MRHIDAIDKIILFIGASMLHAILISEPLTVVPFIVAIIAIGLITYIDDNRKVQLLITAVYTALCAFFPSLTFFLPVVLYGAYERLHYSWIFIAIYPLLCLYLLPVSQGIIMGVFVIVAILLKHRTLDQTALRERFLKLSDETRELSHDLKKQNQALIEKQDSEIHTATLDERNRIAREIHDNVGHQLSSALIQVGALMVTDPSNTGLATLKDTLNLAMDNIRNSVHDLYDESIDLGVQIQKLAEAFTFCKTTLNLHMETVPEPRVKYAILAIIKEALSNVVKHSSASRVDISLVEHPGFYQLIVSDNGSTVTYNPDDGIGLKNIAHRIEALKGYFLIRTNRGFELFITIPKEQTL